MRLTASIYVIATLVQRPLTDPIDTIDGLQLDSALKFRMVSKLTDSMVPR